MASASTTSVRTRARAKMMGGLGPSVTALSDSHIQRPATKQTQRRRASRSRNVRSTSTRRHLQVGILTERAFRGRFVPIRSTKQVHLLEHRIEYAAKSNSAITMSNLKRKSPLKPLTEFAQNCQFVLTNSTFAGSIQPQQIGCAPNY